MMRTSRPAGRLLALILLCTAIAHAQETCPNPPPRLFETSPAATLPTNAPASGLDQAGTKMLILSDNQEHLLTGVQLKSMGVLSDVFVASVAMRSPLAHVGGRLLLAEVLRFGKREDAGLVLHLGDASDISCPNELSSVFDLLDKESPRDKNGEPMWFMAPGNHDGIMLGTFVKYQLPLKELNQPWLDNADGVYDKPPRVGLGHRRRSWLDACLSPTASEDKDHADMSVKGILTKGDAIELYVKRLAARKKSGFRREKLEEPDPQKRGGTNKGEVEIEIENTKIKCKVERITIESQNYTAITRICPPTEVKGNPKNWVGPFASYIVQKLEVGGTPMIMLDTADYINPTECYIGFTAKLTPEQMEHADQLFDKDLFEREKVIVAGHHPLEVFSREQRRWIVKRSTRYLSGHTHKATRLIKHRLSKSQQTEELNIGSTLDYPPQAVIAKLTPGAMSYRVTGADVKKTKWGGFLDVCHCQRDRWRLPPKYYKGYRSGTYVNRLLESLRKAAERAPSGQGLVIPSGDQPDDWKRLHDTLGAINKSEGEAARFWACQAFYASEATREESLLERLRVRPPCGLLERVMF